MVGLLPLCASTVFEADAVHRHPRLMELIELFRKRHPELVSTVAPTSDGYRRIQGTPSAVGPQSRKDWSECSGTCSMRASFSDLTASGRCRAITWTIRLCSTSAVTNTMCSICPAESDTGMFGGNSNWRGPVGCPSMRIIIRALLNLYPFYGDEFKVRVSDRFRALHDALRGGP